MKPAKFPGSLSPLQQDILKGFDPYGGDFFLTGEGALAGFYGSSRPTRDLDLFTRDLEAFEAAPGLLLAVCKDKGWADPFCRRTKLAPTRRCSTFGGPGYPR